MPRTLEPMTRIVGVAGATGRLGSSVARVIDLTEGFTARELDAHGEVDVTGLDMVFDATVYAASQRVVQAAVAAGIPVIVATSGWSQQRIEQLRTDGARGVRIVPNFSIGSIVGTHLAEVAAKYLDYAEVIETHHDGKQDAPSGTAVRTAERIAAVRRQFVPTPDEPGRGTIIDSVPVHAVRMPGVVAEQRVVFGGLGETLTVTHTTTSSDSYAAGIRLALTAEPPTSVAVGLEDLLGLPALEL